MTTRKTKTGGRPGILNSQSMRGMFSFGGENFVGKNWRSIFWGGAGPDIDPSHGVDGVSVVTPLARFCYGPKNWTQREVGRARAGLLGVTV